MLVFKSKQKPPFIKEVQIKLYVKTRKGQYLGTEQVIVNVPVFIPVNTLLVTFLKIKDNDNNTPND